MGTVIGDNEFLELLADKMLKTYTLEEILELNNLTELEVVILLLEEGMIDPDMRVEL